MGGLLPDITVDGVLENTIMTGMLARLAYPINLNSRKIYDTAKADFSLIRGVTIVLRCTARSFSIYSQKASVCAKKKNLNIMKKQVIL